MQSLMKKVKGMTASSFKEAKTEEDLDKGPEVIIVSVGTIKIPIRHP